MSGTVVIRTVNGNKIRISAADLFVTSPNTPITGTVVGLEPRRRTGNNTPGSEWHLERRHIAEVLDE